MKKINKKLILNIIAMLAPIGLIVYFCISENGLFDLLKQAEHFNFLWIFMAILCHFGNTFVDTYIIWRAVRSQEKNFSLWKAIKTGFVGQFFGLITPAYTGAQPAQIYYMSKNGVKSGVATSVLVQRFLAYQTTITVYSAIALACNMTIFQGSFGAAMQSLAAFGFISHAIIVMILFTVSFNPKLTGKSIKFIFKFLSKIKLVKNPQEKIEKTTNQANHFHKSNIYFYKNIKLVVEIYAMTFIQLTLMFLVPYMIYRAFNLSGADITDMIAAQSIVTIIYAFMPLPGGAGAAEGSFYVFFALYFTPETIKSAILVWRIITYILNLIVAAPFARMSRITSMENTQKE